MTIIKDLSLKNGSVVDIEEDKDSIIIKPKETESLGELVSQISKENLHTEIDLGTSQGSEIW